MTSIERRENRYQRRKQRRLEKLQQRANAIGCIDNVFTFTRLYSAGKQSCKGVRWKQSTQNFERHLFSRTAVALTELLNNKWVPSKCTSFQLCERGKVRDIDAPNIRDRQVEKLFTRDVLLPSYTPHLIYNNGASLPKKGFSFTKRLVKRDLKRFIRKFGLNGKLILLDCKKFFPSAQHERLYELHQRYILECELRRLANLIIKSGGKSEGLSIGVEPNQAEMINYTVLFDNYCTCQLGLKFFGHYMDDYYILVPPNVDEKELLKKIREKAKQCGITLNSSKTIVQDISKPFTFCKSRYTITKTHRIVVRCNRKSCMNARRKLKAFKRKIDSGEMTHIQMYAFTNSIIAYLEQYNNHNQVLKLSRLFYTLFGYNFTKYSNFVAADLAREQI